jgi:hypothetical protein
VQAISDCGASALSNSVPVQVITTSAPPAPANLRASGSGAAVTLSWDPAAGGASYLIEAALTRGSTVAALPVGGTSITVPAPSGTDYVRVRALGAAGASAPSSEIVVVVP